MIPLPFVSISVKVFGSAIHQRFEPIQAQLSEMSAVVQEALSGVRVVRAYGQEADGDRAIPGVQRRVRRAEPPADRAAGRVLSEHVVLSGFGALLVLWLGSRESSPARSPSESSSRSTRTSRC